MCCVMIQRKTMTITNNQRRYIVFIMFHTVLSFTSANVNMDAGVKGLVLTLVLDILVLLICILLKHKLASPAWAQTSSTTTSGKVESTDDDDDNGPKTPRSRRKSVLRAISAKNDFSKLRHVRLPLNFHVVFNWLDHVFGELPVRNSSASIYLRFELMAVVLFSVLTFIEVPVLIPLYVEGHNRIMDPTFLERISVANVPVNATVKLYVEFSCVLLSAVLAFCFVWIFASLVRQISLNSLEVVRQQSTRAVRALAHRRLVTLHVWNVNRVIVDESELYTYLDKILPSQIEFCHVALDYSRLEDLFNKRKQARLMTERYVMKETQTGREVFVGGCCGAGSVRAVVFYRHLSDQLDEDLEKERCSQRRGAGHVFIVFRTEPSIEVVRQTLKTAHVVEPHSMYNVNEWSVSAAPHPSDIVWENLHIGRSAQTTRTWFISVMLFLVTVCIVTPVAVLQEVDPLLHSVKNAITKSSDSPVRILITQYSPALIIYIVNSGLTPLFVDVAAEYECHWLHSEMEQSIFGKNFFFMLCNTVLIPMLALNSIESFLVLTYSTEWSEWNQILGRTFLSNSGLFAIRYVIHAGILGAATMMIDFSNRFKRWWRLLWAMTVAERRAADRIWEFEFGYWYACRATVFVLVLLYSTAMPLILPFGVMYFSMVFYVDKGNFEKGWYNFRFETNGQLEYLVARYTYLGIVFCVLAMSGLFIVRGNGNNFELGGILMIIFFVGIAFYWTSWMPTAPESVPPLPNDDKADEEEVVFDFSDLDEPSSDSDADLRIARLTSVPLKEVYAHPLSRTTRPRAWSDEDLP